MKFKIENQKNRLAYADYYGVAYGDVFYCDTCGHWTHIDDDVPMCKCA